MNKIIITIETGGSAFDEIPHYEVARILHELADRYEHEQEPRIIYDINGNSACKIQYE